MNCPRCEGVGLLISYKESIEIDYCPECGGIWLDKGEVKKIIQKAMLQYSDLNSSNATLAVKNSESEKISGFLNKYFDL
ncbi:MAG: zf-TFIIB domain-containing protein [Ignavibacteriaceae bacterium]|nr:zf-TFIIB domain-containing protein [Ignavibacteriaceae bacterium]